MDQYEIFKSSYDEERARTLEIRNTGKIFLGLCAFLLGGFAFKIDKNIFERETGLVIIAMFVTSLALLVCAFVLFLRSIGVYSHETMFNPRSVVEGFGKDPMEDGVFLDERIVDIAVSWERNRKANASRASLIRIASIAMAFGTALAFISLVAYLL